MTAPAAVVEFVSSFSPQSATSSIRKSGADAQFPSETRHLVVVCHPPESNGVQGVAGSNHAVPITYEVGLLLLATGVLFRSRASPLAQRSHERASAASCIEVARRMEPPRARRARRNVRRGNGRAGDHVTHVVLRARLTVTRHLTFPRCRRWNSSRNYSLNVTNSAVGLHAARIFVVVADAFDLFHLFIRCQRLVSRTSSINVRQELRSCSDGRPAGPRGMATSERAHRGEP